MSENTISTSEYQRAVAEATRRKERIRQLEAQLAEKDQKIATLEAEAKQWAEDFDTLDATIKEYESAPPDEKDNRIAELERSIKERDLRSTFEKTAKGKIQDGAIDAAWKLAGLSPDDEYDEAKLAGAVASLVEGNPFLAPASKPDPAVSGSRGADASGKPTAPQGQPAFGTARGNTNHSGQPASASPMADGASAYLQQTGRSSSPNRIA
jgi:hypothetical protein